jgi:predicted transcriptional regulator of viral defense system
MLMHGSLTEIIEENLTKIENEMKRVRLPVVISRTYEAAEELDVCLRKTREIQGLVREVKELAPDASEGGLFTKEWALNRAMEELQNNSKGFL